jgi:hypothetical protein
MKTKDIVATIGVAAILLYFPIYMWIHMEGKIVWDAFLLVEAMLLAYFLPTFIALKRRHSQFFWIALTNLLFGLSGVGWLLALSWSLPPWSFEFKRE